MLKKANTPEEARRQLSSEAADTEKQVKYGRMR